MIFEWHEAGRLKNINEHKVDFVRAALIFDDPLGSRCPTIGATARTGD